MNTYTANQNNHNNNSNDQWQNALQTSDDKLVVVDMFATWCGPSSCSSRLSKISKVTRHIGPCKVISPVVEGFSREFEDVAFYKVDVDDNPDIARELGVRAMPTFFFFKGGEKVADVVGADARKLKVRFDQIQSFEPEI
jgi:thioredoxin 1